MSAGTHSARSESALRVYLADLTYDTILLVSDTIPINIGFIGAYLRRQLGSAVDVTLFKYPGDLIEALKSSPPDILGLSNYSWNTRLAHHCAGIGKRIRPELLTVCGGTDIPHESHVQHEYLLRRPDIDIFVEGEGEVPFADVARRMLAARDGGPPLRSEPIPGCLYLNHGDRVDGKPPLVRGMLPERLTDLGDIPSPYLDGSLDAFFDGRLRPFLETNRGCPFKCSFCHTGNDYYNKVNMFPVERVIEEIEYMAVRSRAAGVDNMHIADTNFGMYKRDREICEAFKRIYERHEWPRHIIATTGKNLKERILEVTDLLGDRLRVNMSVQSMNQEVLENIDRANIKLEHYIAVNEEVTKRGRVSAAELIMNLPGETRSSFRSGVAQILDSGVTYATIYNLILLHGTPFQDPHYREKYAMQGKFRLVPLNFGEYGGKRVFDFEEICIANKDWSFEDYLDTRALALTVEALYNNQPYRSLFLLAREHGVTPSRIVLAAHDRIDEAPEGVRNLVSGFLRETRGELWDSEEALDKHYSRDAQYQELLRGDSGGNKIYRYRGLSLTVAAGDWLTHLAKIIRALIASSDEETDRELDALAEFESLRLAGVLNPEADTAPLSMESDYDILAWMESPGRRLAEFRSDLPRIYVFEYTEHQLAERQEYFRRYGTSVNGISKIVSRVISVQTFYRGVRDRSDAVQCVA